MKREPSYELRQFAAAVHETYIALTDEGFTKREALAIVGQMLAANAQSQRGEDEEQ